jgi:hypothetical protein
MKDILVKIAAFVAAIILLQTLYFKFTAQPESIYIFSKLGLEPYGRIGIGIFELITAILLLFPKTRIQGSVLGIGVISGAIISHLFILGIEVQNDHGELFILALAVLICCLFILIVKRVEAIFLLKQFLKQKS